MFFPQLPGTLLPLAGGFQSSNLQAGPGLRAIVHLQPDEESGVVGDLVFTQLLPNGPVTIEGNVTGLAPGLHGIHVHQAGDIRDNCKDIGEHFIAFYVSIFYLFKFGSCSRLCLRKKP